MDPILVGLLIYLLAMIGVGIYASHHMRSLDDFVLAGRSLGPWVSAISERASGESAWFLLGLPGAAYGLGFVEFWSVIGIACGILFSWTFIAIPLRRETERLGALTLPDYFALRFDDRSGALRVFSMMAILVFYVAYVAAQLNGAGKILNATFGMDAQTGVLIGAAVVVFYTLMGGFMAVAWTDLVQGLLMTVVAVLLPLAGVWQLGGFGALWSKVAAHNPALLHMDGGQTGTAFLFGVAFAGLSWGFGYLGQPHLLTRYMAIRSARELPKGQLIAMGWVLLSYWGAPLIGLVGLAVLGPDLQDAEQVMPLLAKHLLPGWLAGMMIAGAIAAMMSTADSQLLVATSTVVEDTYLRLFKGRVRGQRLVLLSRVATVGIAGVALGLALSQRAASGAINNTVTYAWTGLGSAFGPPLVLALWWRRTTRWGVLAGMAGGIVATVAWKQVPTLGQMLDIKAAPVLISALLVVVVSSLGPRTEEAPAAL